MKLNLPAVTKLGKQIPKSVIISQFNLKGAERERFDQTISRLHIEHEVSSRTISLTSSEGVEGFFVLKVLLKQADFDPKVIIQLAKLIEQRKILFLLLFEEQEKLAIYQHPKLLQTEWDAPAIANFKLEGVNLAQAWESVLAQVAGIAPVEGRSVAEQLTLNDYRAKLVAKIEQLERRARAEKQPKRKFDLVQELRLLKQELEAME